MRASIYDGTLFRDWLEGALADYAAAGGPEKVGLWDATVIGGANSRMIELAESDAGRPGYLDKASAAFRNAIDRNGAEGGVLGADGKPEDFLDLDQYRRRLAYDGYVLALERAMIRLRGDRFLSGVDAQPGDGLRPARLADIGYAALDFARQREALRKRGRGQRPHREELDLEPRHARRFLLGVDGGADGCPASPRGGLQRHAGPLRAARGPSLRRHPFDRRAWTMTHSTSCGHGRLR